jgi:hypothetical protein
VRGITAVDPIDTEWERLVDAFGGRDRSVLSWGTDRPERREFSGQHGDRARGVALWNFGTQRLPNYRYDLSLTVGAGGKKWSLDAASPSWIPLPLVAWVFLWPVLLTMREYAAKETLGWRIDTHDATLRRRLTDAGALAEVGRWEPELGRLVAYDPDEGAIRHAESATGLDAIPTVEQVRAQLAVLERLAAINAGANTRRRPPRTIAVRRALLGVALSLCLALTIGGLGVLLPRAVGNDVVAWGTIYYLIVMLGLAGMVFVRADPWGEWLADRLHRAAPGDVTA